MSDAPSPLQRLVWLRRRLRRMAPGELMHRVHEGVRMVSQRLGWGDARRIPPRAADARYGAPWCRIPPAHELGEAAMAATVAAADKLLFTGPTLFGQALPADARWNADPRTGWVAPDRFGLFIDFRHLPQGVDVKFLWELNRHVWWLPLAQAWALTGNRAYLNRLRSLLESWLDDCVYPNGPNWSSPVEQGVRLIAWSAVWHLVGGVGSPLFEGARGAALLDRWMNSVYQHIRFASDNYSLYSSANNHLVAEAAGVFVAAQTWDLWQAVRPLRAQAKAVLEREILLQFGQDGLNAEQAICYHKFVLQLTLPAALVGRENGDALAAPVEQRLQQALVALAALMDSAGQVPMYGDADDGEVYRFDVMPSYSPYAALVALGAAMTGSAAMVAKAQTVRLLAGTHSNWLCVWGAPPSTQPAPTPALASLPTQFADAGIVVLGDALHQAHEFRAQLDVGPLGYNAIAGHGHADALSLQVTVAGEALLVDPGTYCYNTEPAWRHYFRSTRAHNTLEVEGTDQSVYGGSFLWLRDVTCTVDSMCDVGSSIEVVAHHDGYTRLSDPVVHHRRVRLERKSRVLEVEDWLTCQHPHDVVLHWHAAGQASLVPVRSGVWQLIGRTQSLTLELVGEDLHSTVVESALSPIQGWVSDCFYHRAGAPVLVVRARLRPGQRLLTRLFDNAVCGPGANPHSLAAASARPAVTDAADSVRQA